MQQQKQQEEEEEESKSIAHRLRITYLWYRGEQTLHLWHLPEASIILKDPALHHPKQATSTQLSHTKCHHETT